MGLVLVVLAFVDGIDGRSLLSIGCGNGNCMVEVVMDEGGVHLVGVDGVGEMLCGGEMLLVLVFMV